MRNKTILVSIFNLINTGFQFFFVFLLSRLFTQDEYGFYRKFFLIFEISAPLIGLGLSSSIFYFYNRTKNKRNLILNNVFLVLIASILFLILILVFNKNLINYLEIDNTYLLFLFPVFSFFSVSNTILYSFFVLENNVKNSISINLLVNILLSIGLFYLGYNKFNIEYAIIFRTIAYLLIFLLMIRNISKSSKIYIDFRYLKIILNTSLPICLSLFLGLLSGYLDKIVVSKFISTKDYAIYVNGSFEIPLISIITTSISVALFASLNNHVKNNNYDLASKLFKKSANVSSLFIYPCFAFFLIYSEEFIVLIFGEEYKESSLIFSFYLLLLPIRIIQYGNVLIALGKSNILLYRSIVELLISLILSITFLHTLGYQYAVLGMIISVLFWTVPLNLFVISKGFGSKLYNVIDFKFLIKNILFSLGLALIIKYTLDIFNFSNTIFFMISLIFFYLIYFAFLLILRIIDLKELKNLKDLKKIKINL